MRSGRLLISFGMALSVFMAMPSSVCAQKKLTPLYRALTKKTVSLGSRKTVSGVALAKQLTSFQYAGKTLSLGDFDVSVARAVMLNPLRVVRPKHNFFPGKKTIDAVIFDLDGTLLDSLSAWERSGSNFLRTQGIEPNFDFDAAVAKMSLMDGARLAKEQFALSQSPEEILRLTLEPIRQRYYRDIPPKAGVPEMLRFLHAQGIKLCVATASDRELTEAALRRTGLLKYFDFIITCDEVGVGKTSPAIYETALQKLGTDKSRTIVAEDALYALTTAKKAGFVTAAIADKHSFKDQPFLQRTADYYIYSFEQCQMGR